MLGIGVMKNGNWIFQFVPNCTENPDYTGAKDPLEIMNKLSQLGYISAVQDAGLTDDELQSILNCIYTGIAKYTGTELTDDSEYPVLVDFVVTAIEEE